MSQKVEDGSMLDGPFDGLANCRQKPFQLPAARSECTNVADGTHRNLDQTVWIDEGLRVGLRGDDRIDDSAGRLLHRFGVWMRRI